jgi:FKBP-type peptidyl-prolyl cis-trans isomerase
MEYTGTLADGTVFDTNGPTRENSKPFRFVVGNGSVIKGWDLGVVGMKVGGTRELEIPSQLGYGSKDQGKIPPNSDLFFTVKLLAVVKKGQDAVYDPPKDTKMGTGPAVKDGDWVTIEYKSEYMNGAEFASSPDGKPLEFQTITGLTRSGDKMGVTGLLYCLRGMKEGGTREIVLPPSIAYTLAQMDNERNPSNLTLKYTVHLLKVKPGTLPKSAKKS